MLIHMAWLEMHHSCVFVVCVHASMYAISLYVCQRIICMFIHVSMMYVRMHASV